jgi:hypothetical protein
MISLLTPMKKLAHPMETIFFGRFPKILPFFSPDPE